MRLEVYTDAAPKPADCIPPVIKIGELVFVPNEKLFVFSFFL